MSQSQAGGPKDTGITTEIPSFLKQLARLVAQGFYQVEDALIVDMLVRNPCIKEKDLEDLLKFDLKLLRSRLATLKSEKVIHLRLRMETGVDGKAQKVNYYFINFKSFVNVIKYKLDHLRKKLETMERDATHRASFKCTNCVKTFTDLEAGELFDPTTLQFRCTFCYQLVEEDESAGPKTDSRFVLARFNEQMQVIYDLLAKAEGIKLAPELLEPEPPRGSNDANNDSSNASGRDRSGFWSGEATRLQGTSDTRIDIKFGEARAKADEERKERPVWLTESTIGEDSSSNFASTAAWNTNSESPSTSSTNVGRAPKEDIMNVLLAFERKSGRSTQPQAPKPDLDFSSDSGAKAHANHSNSYTPNTSMIEMDGVEIMDSDDDNDDDNAIPLVSIGTQKIPITEVNNEIIDKMTILEKEAYSQQFQDYYANLYD